MVKTACNTDADPNAHMVFLLNKHVSVTTRAGTSFQGVLQWYSSKTLCLCRMDGCEERLLRDGALVCAQGAATGAQGTATGAQGAATGAQGTATGAQGAATGAQDKSLFTLPFVGQKVVLQYEQGLRTGVVMHCTSDACARVYFVSGDGGRVTSFLVPIDAIRLAIASEPTVPRPLGRPFAGGTLYDKSCTEGGGGPDCDSSGPAASSKDCGSGGNNGSSGSSGSSGGGSYLLRQQPAEDVTTDQRQATPNRRGGYGL